MKPDHIKFVLLQTQHPGNIGAAARAMKNMGLSRLVLVNPLQFPHADAIARASGADDVLQSAQVVASLTEAIADCHLVLGLSARSRKITWPTLTAREAALRTCGECEKDAVALVFGPERIGMTNEELQRCHFHVHIPANPEYSSLNLAAAVQIMAYEVRMAGLAPGQARAQDPQWTTNMEAEDMERFFEHLEQTLLDVGFLAEQTPRAKLLRRLRRFFLRANPDSREINILRGIFSAAQSSAKIK